MAPPVIPDDPSVIRPTLEHLKKTFLTGRTKDISFRIQQLKNLARGIKELSSKIDEAVHQDIGLSPFINYMASSTPCLNEIEDCIRNVRKWSKKESVNTPVPLGPAKSYIVPEPYGVCLVLSAWNYPLVTLIPPVATAIAAGNCVIAKPSEMAPHTSKVMLELFEKYLDKDCYRVIEGQVQVAIAITKEKFDVLVFTGSPEKGRLVAKAAAENLIPCVLELGGKSPTIVDQDANIDNAAMRIITGRFLNAGQTCIAPDYCFAHKSVKEKFLNKLKEYRNKFHGEDPKKDPHYGRMINEWHANRLKEYLDDNHGGKIVFGGEVDIKSKYVAPTVVDSPSVKSKMMQDEIFGPILPVFEFTEIDDVIKFINEREKPLALYYYGGNSNPHKERLIKETSSGAVMVNDSLFHLLNSELPFGGVGNSGYGACHGKIGFDCLSHKKPVMEKYAINMFPFNARYPPYNQSRQKLIKFLFGTFSVSQYDALRIIFFLILAVTIFLNWNCVKSFGNCAGKTMTKVFGNGTNSTGEL
mmetsp:Transcript_44750/g.51697  ORF Transcript_44750/g.51697 Transcript_44750/m.51697 type:complete len:527 (+) Transcript_44750:48-1628(+)